MSRNERRGKAARRLGQELAAAAEAFSYGWDDLQWFTVNAMKSAFLSFDERLERINGVIKPGFDQLRWRGARPLG